MPSRSVEPDARALWPAPAGSEARSRELDQEFRLFDLADHPQPALGGQAAISPMPRLVEAIRAAACWRLKALEGIRRRRGAGAARARPRHRLWSGGPALRCKNPAPRIWRTQFVFNPGGDRAGWRSGV